MAEILSYPRDRDERYLVKMVHVGRRVGAQKEHWHRYAELMLVLEGQAIDLIDGQEYHIQAGDVYVLYPGMLHEQREAQGYRYAIIKFDHEAFMTEAESLRGLPGFHLLFSMKSGSALRAVADDATLGAVEPLARMMEQEMQNASPESEALVWHLFMAAVAILCRSCQPSLPSLRSYRQVIAKALGYMETHYAESVHLEDLAGITGYSRRHFTRLFRENMCCSATEYLTELRLNAACRLLKQNEPLTAVAAACGFSDAAALCHAFRRRFGVTPKAFRMK
ncbi:MAG: helix-turn-helix domain-containing protein [Ruminococcaceae bacterium]|nr:helix-turn-helix domain-containing protein [Oscillospiraceae bacterium]